MTMDEVTHQAKSVVAQAGRVLASLGLVDYLGHASARIPGQDLLVIKPKHSPRVRGMATLTDSDMIIVSLEGELIVGENPPPSEVYIHSEIYRARSDVYGIVHTHQQNATRMAILGAQILPLLHTQSTWIPAEIPVWPHSVLVTDSDLGADLASTLGDSPFCHMLGHGIVSAASDLRHATVAAIMLEDLAEANLDVLRTGKVPRVISESEIEMLRRQQASVDGRWAYYCQVADG